MNSENKEWFEEASIADYEKPREREAGLRVVERLARKESTFELKSISQTLRPILHYRYFSCALLRVYDARILRVVNLDFPRDCLEAMKLRAGSDACPLVKQWLNIRAPIIVHAASCAAAPGPSVELPSWPSSEGALAVHAQLDSTGTRGLVFCFGGVAVSPELDESLRYLTPSLFSALAKAFWAPIKSVDCRALTTREIEVLEWLYCGKKNEEIACLLKISIYTVKNHVQKILLKLSATNRTQAVLRAVDAGVVRGHDHGTQQPPDDKEQVWAH
ncbi:MAG TPA: LuxR C-terminal-related transcriptional regulator [Terriglobia bacterium]|nr:LuxR C-terminal-related transcriptional regulator [Terriglobia bacterium]HEU5134149.1 LuxR C-terminal-related transcriptional regulator [Steroidobacteraceae bacterium]